MKVWVKYLILILTISLIFPSISTTGVLAPEPDIALEIDMLVFTDGDSLDLLDGLGVPVIERYDDFVMARLSAGQHDTLERYGIRAVELMHRTTVYVNGHVFDIMGDGPDLPSNLKILEYETDQEGLYIVHLLGPVKETWTDAIRETGARLVNYIPNYAYEVRMTPGVKGQVEALPFVDAIVPFHPAYKISPAIESQGLSMTLMDSST